MSLTRAAVHFAAPAKRGRLRPTPRITEVDAQASFLHILDVVQRPGLEQAATESPAVAISCEFHPTWVELAVGYQDGSRSSCTVDTSLKQNLQLRSAYGIHSLYPLEAGSTAVMTFAPILPLTVDD